jgi:hypothetical protein
MATCCVGSAFLKSNATCLVDDLGVARFFERKPQRLVCGKASDFVLIELPDDSAMVQDDLFLFPHRSDDRHDRILSSL